jgi:hypothetical protein
LLFGQSKLEEPRSSHPGSQRQRRETESEREAGGLGEKSRKEGDTHHGFKSMWETPPGFCHQNVRKGLVRRAETSMESNHTLLARQKGVAAQGDEGA